MGFAYQVEGLASIHWTIIAAPIIANFINNLHLEYLNFKKGKNERTKI